MKTKEKKKGKPTAKKTGKSVDPKGRTKPKVDENVCKQSEPVSESLCCCEEVCC
jgi:hypothetical protein